MSLLTILNAFQPELIPIVIAAAVGASGYCYQWGIQRLPTNAQKMVNGLAHTAIQAVEQKYIGLAPGGAYKKQEAMSTVAAMCQELGLPFNQSNASTAIEAAVYAMNLYQQFPVPPVSQTTRSLPDIVDTPKPDQGAGAAT